GRPGPAQRGGYPRGEGDLGGQGQRPERGRLAEVARAAVQQRPEPFAPAVVEEGAGRPGAVGLRLQAGGPLGLEGPEGVADSLGRAAEPAVDRGGLEPLGAGQQDLAAAEREGRGRAPAGPNRLVLVGAQRSDEEGRFHTLSTAAVLQRVSCDFALASYAGPFDDPAPPPRMPPR